MSFPLAASPSAAPREPSLQPPGAVRHEAEAGSPAEHHLGGWTPHTAQHPVPQAHEGYCKREDAENKAPGAAWGPVDELCEGDSERLSA